MELISFYSSDILRDIHNLNTYIQYGNDDNVDNLIRNLAKNKVRLQFTERNDLPNEPRISYV